jgi:hypothetical protein
VDNTIITGNDDKNIQYLKHHMMTTFCMTDLGNASYYLGVEIQQCLEGTYFHQRGYIKKLLDKFSMSGCTLTSISMNPKTKLQKDTSSVPIDPVLY